MPCENRRRTHRENRESEATPNPRFILMVGLPGAGKSFILRDHFGGSVSVINSDSIMRSLPGALEIIESGDPQGLGDLHAIAQPLASEAVREAIESGAGAWAYDSTGTGERLSRFATDAVAAGFDVTVLHVSVTVATAMRRNAARFAAGGRLVPETVINAKAEVIEARVAALTRIEGVAVIEVDNNTDLSPAELEASA